MLYLGIFYGIYGYHIQSLRFPLFLVLLGFFFIRFWKQWKFIVFMLTPHIYIGNSVFSFWFYFFSLHVILRMDKISNQRYWLSIFIALVYPSVPNWPERTFIKIVRDWVNEEKEEKTFDIISWKNEPICLLLVRELKEKKCCRTRGTK